MTLGDVDPGANVTLDGLKDTVNPPLVTVEVNATLPEKFARLVTLKLIVVDDPTLNVAYCFGTFTLMSLMKRVKLRMCRGVFDVSP
jgi:hypothetical protein